MSGIQILNELITQRHEAMKANQKIVAWTLSPDAFMRLRSESHNSSVFAELDRRRDMVFVEGVPAYFNARQERQVIPWRDEAMMRKETGIC